MAARSEIPRAVTASQTARAGRPAPWFRSVLTTGLGLVLLLVLWAACATLVGSAYLLPSPTAVAASIGQNWRQILWHGQATLTVVLLGFAVGFVTALVLGYAISRSRRLEEVLAPFLVGSQAVPVVAVAPILVYWFHGPGLGVRVTVAALIMFFPVLVYTVVGLRGIDPGYRELMHVLSAGRWQTLWWVELPAALPTLFGALRVGLTLAVIGAVVGEFLGADRGLGALIQIARGGYNDPLMFAALVALAALALTLYGLALALERYSLRHHVAAAG